MMNNEIWKDIKGYEGLYQVSNLGNVRSLGNNKKRKEKILKLSQTPKGYQIVYLSNKNQGKNYYIHRLVASAFIPNPNNLPQVNHKDEIKTNNMVDNLEWCDCEYNINYGTRNDKMNITKKAKPIYSINITTNEITFYQSAYAAQKQTNISQTSICMCCRGKIKTSGGYKWKYV